MIKVFKKSGVKGIRKLTAIFMSLLLVLSVSMLVGAETFETDDFVIEIPDNFIVLTQSLDKKDPLWEKAGIYDVKSAKKSYGNMSALANFISEDGAINILLTWKISDESMDIYSLKGASESEKKILLDSVTYNEDEALDAESHYVDINDEYDFFEMKIGGVLGGYDIHERVLGTIFNGNAISFDTFSYEGEISEETIKVMDDMAKSLKVTKVIPKDENSNYKEYVDLEITPLMWIIFIAFFLMLIVTAIFLIFNAVRNKRIKKNDQKLVSEFIATHKDFNPSDSKARFINTTNFSGEAIHRFSMFHAYKRNLFPMILGIVIALFLLLALVYIKGSKLMILVLILLISVYAARIATAGRSTERMQRAQLEGAPSKIAHYAFFDEAFRISGIQSPNMYPYFHVKEIKQNDNYLYLYYSPEDAYMIDINGMKKGDKEEFVRFIEKKVNGGK